MMAEPIRTLGLNHPMIQFLIRYINIQYNRLYIFFCFQLEASVGNGISENHEKILSWIKEQGKKQKP